jgi:hypothetical protein
MVGLGAGAPLLALMATKRGAFDRRANDGATRIGELVDETGAATPLARARAGEQVRVAGFYAPALRAGALFDLYERTTAPCLACGLIHDPGASLTVGGAAAPAGLSMMRSMELAGRLDIDAGGAPRLII